MTVESIKNFKEIAENIRTCMFCTKGLNGMESRPMSTSQVDEKGNVWFFTHKGDEVAKQVENGDVHLCYADNSNDIYLSVRGSAELVENPIKVDELWSPILNAWFPNGKETEDLILIQVKPNHVEYWNGVSTLRTLFDAAKAKITGEKGAEGEHKKLM